jgi:hypothetical protein
MGAPQEMEEEPPATPDPTTAEKSDIEKRLDALERDNKAKDARIKEVEESERYWHSRAQGGPPPNDPDPDPDPVPIEAPDPFAGEKPDKFLDDLSVKGLQAAFDRGVLSRKQLDEGLAALEQRVLRTVEQRLELSARHNALDSQLAAEFPELAADGKALKADPQAKTSPMWQRTQERFREIIADDPAMKGSASALLLAARTAKRELALEAKVAGEERNGEQRSRRERIAAQAADRDGGANGGLEGGDELSSQAREIVGHLSGFLEKRVTDPKTGRSRIVQSAEDVYRRHAGNGRGR